MLAQRRVSEQPGLAWFVFSYKDDWLVCVHTRRFDFFPLLAVSLGLSAAAAPERPGSPGACAEGAAALWSCCSARAATLSIRSVLWRAEPCGTRRPEVRDACVSVHHKYHINPLCLPINSKLADTDSSCRFVRCN